MSVVDMADWRAQRDARDDEARWGEAPWGCEQATWVKYCREAEEIRERHRAFIERA